MGHGRQSIVFDRAVAYYDRTRRLHPATLEAVTALLAAELGGRGRCLEIGVGTGRIALPLADAGVELAGVDLSLPMLQTLVANAGGAAPFPVAVADATRLPFADGAFGGAFACHVLHLVAGWQQAVDELWRVVRPGGLILVDAGAGWPPEESAIGRRFAEVSGADRSLPGLADPQALDAAMAARGARLRLPPPVENLRQGPLSGTLSEFEEGLHSWTWQLDEPTRRGVAAEVRAWAAEEFGDLDEPRDLVGTIQWGAYDLPVR